MINFGAFQQGYNENEKILAAKRKENAALYADFIQSNPGASADEREKFAQSLAGNNKSFRAILPTRSMMESNVAEYNRKRNIELENAARKRKLEDLKVAKDASTYMADLLQTTDAKTASEMVQAQYGSLLSEDSLPAVAAQADRLGWAQYQQDAAPLIQNFQNNPTQANLDSLKRDGFNSAWGDRLVQQYTPVLDRAKVAADAAANAAIMDIAKNADLDDENFFKTQRDAEFAKYDGLLTKEQKMKMEANAQQVLKDRRAARELGNKGKLAIITDDIMSKVGTEGYQTDAEIADKLRLAVEADPDLKDINTTDALTALEKDLSDKRKVKLDEINQTEETTIREKTAEALTNRTYEDTNANLEAIENIVKQQLDGVDLEGKNVTTDVNLKVAKISGQVIQNLSTFGAYGVNVNDQTTVSTLTRYALEFKKREQGAEIEGAGVEVELDQRHFAQAFDEMLRSGQLDPIEQMAIAKALEAKGYGGMVDVITLGDRSFSAKVQEEIKGMIRQQNDIFGKTQSTLESVGDAAETASSELLSQVNNTEIEDMLKAGQELLAATVSKQNILDLQATGDQAKQHLNKLMITANDIRAEAARLDKLASSEFYNQDRNAVDIARNKAAELVKKAESLEQMAEGVSDMMLDIRGRMTVAPSGNSPNRNAEILPQVVANYAASIQVAMDQASEAGTDLTPDQMAEMVFRLVKSNEDLVPTKQDRNRRFTKDVPDYLSMMEMIYAEFGMTIDDIPDKYK